jgi:hypothetical protein
MAGLPGLTRSFGDLQQIQANAYSAASKKNNLPVANLGSFAPMGGIFNATAMAVLAVQAQADYVNTVSRLLTSSGPDVDSYIAPYGIPREAAGFATGTATFTTNSPVAAKTLALQVGAIVSRVADSLQYQVVADTSGANSAFDPSANGGQGAYYLQNEGDQVVSFSFVCLTAGSVGNCDAGAIDSFYGGPGVTALATTGTITNPTPVSNGTDAESDSLYIARFQDEMIGGSVGTSYAYLKAALSADTGLTVSIGDTLDASGTTKLSWFTVFVNKLGQSAGPSTQLLAEVSTAIEAVRAAGTRFSVVAPTLLTIAVTANLHGDGTMTPDAMKAAATAAVTAFINNIGMVQIQNAGSLTTIQVPLFLIGEAMRGLVDGVSTTGVAYPSNVQINGGFTDLTVGYGVQPIVSTVVFGLD